jgi:hypothetical protein
VFRAELLREKVRVQEDCVCLPLHRLVSCGQPLDTPTALSVDWRLRADPRYQSSLLTERLLQMETCEGNCPRLVSGNPPVIMLSTTHIARDGF